MDVELILDLLQEPSLAPHLQDFLKQVQFEYAQAAVYTDCPTAIGRLRKFVDEYKYVDSEGSKKLPFAKRMVLATALKALHSQLAAKETK